MIADSIYLSKMEGRSYYFDKKYIPVLNEGKMKFRDPAILPKTIPLHTMEQFLSVIYTRHSEAKTDCQKKKTLSDIAVIELLFATGMRISELCSLKMGDVNLYDRSILIYGE